MGENKYGLDDWSLLLFLKTEKEGHKPFFLGDHIPPYGINLPELVKAYLIHDGHPKRTKGKIYHRYYQRLRNRVEKLRDFEIISVSDVDGLVHIQNTEIFLYLINYIRNSTPEKLLSFLKRKPMNRHRRSATNLTSNVDRLNEKGQTLIINYMDNWRSEAIHKHILLLKKVPGVDIEYSIPLRQTSRFLSKKKLKATLGRFHNILEQAGESYQKALFITLTTDPKQFPSIDAAKDHLRIALKRFETILKRKYGRNPEKIIFNDFMENGLPHLHIFIFGIPGNFIHHKWLQRIWRDKCQQGEQVWINQVQYKNNRWIPHRGKMGNSKISGDIESYLIKFLRKYLRDPSQPSIQIAMYWVTGKRIYSCSRKFNEKQKKKASKTKSKVIGVFSGEVTAWIRKHSITGRSALPLFTLSESDKNSAGRQEHDR